MSVESILDGAFTELLAKAHQPLPDDPRIRKPSTLNFQWSGEGAPLVLTQVGSRKLVIPYPARIQWARLSAGDALDNPVAVTATVRINLTSFTTFGASVPLSGTGTIPTITADSIADCDLTGWQTNLLPGDWLVARMMTYSGTAEWVSLDIMIRPTGDDIGVTDITDAGADTIVDNDGNVVVLRS